MAILDLRFYAIPFRFLLFLKILVSMFAFGQQITRTELGVGYYGQTNTNFAGTQSAYRSGYSGPFARFSFNLNQSVALEASEFDSTNLVPSDNKGGGHQVLVLGGIKAGLRRRHLGVFGRLDAGAASYSRGLELIEVDNGRILNVPPTYYRETHFALEPGATVEVYLASRTIVRADVDENLNAVFRSVNFLGGNLYQDLGGYVPHHLGVSLSLEHRFGRLEEDAPVFSPKPEHFSVGGYFPLQIRGQTENFNAPALGGGGAWIEAPIFRLLSADVVAFDLPHDDFTAGTQNGGTPFAAFAGPKAGFHLDRFGVFVKARPGITRFSRTESSLTLTSDGQFISVNHPQYQFSLDTGGVFEYTPARHVQVRLEVGDNLIFYHAHSVAYSYPGEQGIATTPATHASSMLFLVGAGWLNHRGTHRRKFNVDSLKNTTTWMLCSIHVRCFAIVGPLPFLRASALGELDGIPSN